MFSANCLTPSLKRAEVAKVCVPWNAPTESWIFISCHSAAAESLAAIVGDDLRCP